jgi:hypothetical protein
MAMVEGEEVAASVSKREPASPSVYADPFVTIDYAHPDADQINALVDGNAREHDVRNSPLEAR